MLAAATQKKGNKSFDVGVYENVTFQIVYRL